jgi:hypothetical protein
MPPRLFSRNVNFNPILISSQIILLISIFYVIFIFFTITYSTLFGLQVHIDQILSVDSFDNSYGYCALSANLSTHVIMTFVYIIVVEKANKILDYSLTTFFIHFLLTTLNSRIPFTFAWWVVNLGCFISVILVSEFISLKIDQRDISLNFNFADNRV